MITHGLYVRLKAKAGKENDVAEFLRGALPIAEDEPETLTWYAIRLDHSTFAIFDTFANEHGRETHLAGRIAAELTARAPDLLAEPPVIEEVDVLASKAPRESDQALAA